MNSWVTKLQQYIDKIINEQSSSSKGISNAYQNVIDSIEISISISKEVQDAIQQNNVNALAANEAIIKSLRDTIAPHSKSIALSNELHEAISFSQASTLESMDAISRSIPRLAEINESFLNSIPSLVNTPAEDYVTVDESVLHEIDIPDRLVLSVGKCRFKISTSLFITILEMVITIFLTIFMTAGGDNFSMSKDSQNQSQTLIEQNEMLTEQNQILFELLDSVDASESSQADLINSWKESFLSEN